MKKVGSMELLTDINRINGVVHMKRTGDTQTLCKCDPSSQLVTFRWDMMDKKDHERYFCANCQAKLHRETRTKVGTRHARPRCSE